MANKLVFMLLYFIFININRDSHYVSEFKIHKNIQINLNKPNFLAKVKEEENKDLLATITIDSISIYDRPIYSIESNKNTIDKNITILKGSIMPNENKSIIFLAAHSGMGSLAYFKNLYKLKLNEKIIFKYNGINYIYKISNIYEEDKNGYIYVNDDCNNKIILTTCSDNDKKQLIVEGILIK